MGRTERIEEAEIEAALQREIPDEPATRKRGWCKKLGCPVREHRA